MLSSKKSILSPAAPVIPKTARESNQIKDAERVKKSVRISTRKVSDINGVVIYILASQHNKKRVVKMTQKKQQKHEVYTVCILIKREKTVF